jgi:hypothetical protein
MDLLNILLRFFILIFVLCILFCVCEQPTNALNFSSLLVYSAAPTCFGTYVSSSRNSFVPADLHANRKQWLIRLCVIRGYVLTTIAFDSYVTKQARNSSMMMIRMCRNV